VENISVINQRWWGITNIFVSNALFRNIHFDADFSRIDKNGVHHPGERPITADEVYVKNADGIDLRRGCHDIVIENITGFTEDDTVALTALNGGYEDFFNAPYAENGIYNVKIRNIKAASFCTIVRLLNQGGMVMHDIDIDNVYDTCESCEYLDKGLYAVRLGDKSMYGESYPTPDMTYNISIKNVYGRGEKAVMLYGEHKNVVTENIDG
jgi:hypothetical protein